MQSDVAKRFVACGAMSEPGSTASRGRTAAPTRRDSSSIRERRHGAQIAPDRENKMRAGAHARRAKAALADYVSYFGTYTVDERAGTVTHHRQASVQPGPAHRLCTELRVYGRPADPAAVGTTQEVCGSGSSEQLVIASEQRVIASEAKHLRHACERCQIASSPAGSSQAAIFGSTMRGVHGRPDAAARRNRREGRLPNGSRRPATRSRRATTCFEIETEQGLDEVPGDRGRRADRSARRGREIARSARGGRRYPPARGREADARETRSPASAATPAPAARAPAAATAAPTAAPTPQRAVRSTRSTRSGLPERNYGPAKLASGVTVSRSPAGWRGSRHRSFAHHGIRPAWPHPGEGRHGREATTPPHGRPPRARPPRR